MMHQPCGKAAQHWYSSDVASLTWGLLELVAHYASQQLVHKGVRLGGGLVSSITLQHSRASYGSEERGAARGGEVEVAGFAAAVPGSVGSCTRGDVSMARCRAAMCFVQGAKRPLGGSHTAADLCDCMWRQARHSLSMAAACQQASQRRAEVNGC